MGSILNPSKLPSNLKVYVEQGAVNVEGGGLAYYVLYAPDSDVNFIGGSAVYGNLVGKNLTVDQGSFVHFDPASGGAAVAGGSTTSTIVTHQRF